jgi:hypothetical protein
MGSFDLTYDGEQDVLEITFEVFDENFTRTLSLNDHIFVFTDLALQTVWGLTFYSYSRLLGVSETEFTALRDQPEELVTNALALLYRPPASRFFDVTDPEGLIARVCAPNIQTLIE